MKWPHAWEWWACPLCGKRMRDDGSTLAARRMGAHVDWHCGGAVPLPASSLELNILQ